MRKKGVEMSLNVIIIAAIGLLILVILAFLVINYLSNTRQGLESCTAKYGGLCVSRTSCDTAGGKAEIISAATDCTKNNQNNVCCRTVNIVG
jgi:hypothetical protein